MSNEKIYKKKKRRRLKVGYILAIILIIAFIVVGIKLVLPGNGVSKYGDRLEGIEKIKFTKKDQKAIVDKINSFEKRNSAKVLIQGKIINIMFNMDNEGTKEDAKWAADEVLKIIPDEVKNYYDIQFMVTKKNEEGKKETIVNSDGEKEEIIKKDYPIMGYKNSKSSKVVW